MKDDSSDPQRWLATLHELGKPMVEPRRPKPVYVLPVKDGIMSFWHIGDGIYDVNITLRRGHESL
jgi:hypothetical protein